MTLAPLLAAPLAIQLHAIAALSLIPLTLVQLGRRKSGAWHRRVGWAWVILMAITAVSSFWIHGIRLFGPFSLIHILSVITLLTLVHAIHARRTGNMRGHRLGMLGVTAGWAGAGLFTLLPYRIMGQVVFGG
jgi:uncharacterized membrane protein